MKHCSLRSYYRRFRGHGTRILGAAVLTTASPGIGSAASEVHADFNGDGFGDLVVGVPGESVGSLQRAGAVNVIYGSPDALLEAGSQIWTQAAPGIALRWQSTVVASKH